MHLGIFNLLHGGLFGRSQGICFGGFDLKILCVDPPLVFQVTDVVDDAGTRTSLGRYCGNTFPSDQLRSTGNTMIVTFRSDANNNYNGFAATFTACMF